jgi:hypothetical protein
VRKAIYYRCVLRAFEVYTRRGKFLFVTLMCFPIETRSYVVAVFFCVSGKIRVGYCVLFVKCRRKWLFLDVKIFLDFGVMS